MANPAPYDGEWSEFADVMSELADEGIIDTIIAEAMCHMHLHGGSDVAVVATEPDV